METPTTKEVALLNSCLDAIDEDGAHVKRIAEAAGVSQDRAKVALDILEKDGIVYSFSFGFLTRKYYARRPPEPPFAIEPMPWCDQCDCYHHTNARCIDEIR
jgi:hypothetical protein